MDNRTDFNPPAIAGGLSIIEQVQKNEEGFLCETPNRPYLIALDKNEKLAVFFKPRCKLWSCPACSETNKKLWTVRVYQGASNLTANGHVLNFLTLTSHEKTDKRSSLKIWPLAWKKLRERANYERKGFQYVLIPEQHKNGRLHVHALETAGLGKRWWKDNARECGLGFMADEQIARTAGGAAVYVTKYLTKSIAYQEWPKGFRRVRVSQRWPKLPAEQLQAWEFEVVPQRVQLSDRAEDLKSQGYRIENLDHRAAWEYIQQIQAYLDLLEQKFEL